VYGEDCQHRTQFLEDHPRSTTTDQRMTKSLWILFWRAQICILDERCTKQVSPNQTWPICYIFKDNFENLDAITRNWNNTKI